ncbi:12109_t:CDS:2, partial [Racocetra persica]
DASTQHQLRTNRAKERYLCQNQHNAITHLSRQTNNLQLLNFAHNFSEVLNTNKHPFSHHIDVESSTNCTYCNALKLPTESLRIYCLNRKMVLAEPNISPLLNHLFSIPNSGLNLEIIQSLKNMLDEINHYVINFYYISMLSTESIKNLAVIIQANIPELDLQTYNTSTTSQVAAIWVDDK